MPPTRELDKLLLRNADRTEATTKAFEQELAKRYREAYKVIEGQLASLYAKMGDSPSLTEARRYGRLDSVKRAIAEEYRKLTRKAINGTLDNSASTYADAYYGSAWAYDQALGVAIKWPILPVEAIRASVYSTQSGEYFVDRFRNWEIKDTMKINQTITRMLVTGQSINKTARALSRKSWFEKTVEAIRDDMSKSYQHAQMIVRTEAGRNYTQGHLELYDKLDDLGIKAKKQWVATLDTRTRDTHGALDGQFADEKGLFYIGGDSAEGPGLFSQPENVINCRCRIIEVIDGLEPEFRRVRGKGIVEYQTYEQWAKDNGKTSTGWPIEAKARVAESQARRY